MSEIPKPPKSPPISKARSGLFSIVFVSFLSGGFAGALSSIVALASTQSTPPKAEVVEVDSASNDIDLLTMEIANTQKRLAALELLPESIEKYSPEIVERAVGEVDVQFDLGGRVRNAALFPFTDFHKGRLKKAGLSIPGASQP